MLTGIKSNYILKYIFKTICQNKTLSLIKHNKKLQKRLQISLSDYKSFFQIELEITPILINNSEKQVFIKIYDFNKEFFHIFFNNDFTKRIKKNYITKKEEITKINIIIDCGNKFFSKLFKNCICIKEINFTKFNRKDIIDINEMFCGCKNLKEINVSFFKTQNVVDMNNLFSECRSLKEININNFNTNKVINMSKMFENCSSLEKLDISNFNTLNVIDMGNMFNGCTSLKEINFSNANTIGVKKYELLI